MTEADKTKRPASQYYWGDWFKDVALQSCSLPARGLWHEMNCLMHQGEPYGHLTMPNGKPMEPLQLGNLCKIGPALCRKLIAELEGNGVLSRAENGTIFSRRMVRDEDLRNRRAAGGKEGAEHGIKGAEAGSKGGRPKQVKGGYETPLPGFEEPPPSSSSSSSSSNTSGANAPSSTARLPTCHPDQVVAIYHEVLPELPGVRVMDKAREKAIRERWQWVLSSTKPDGTRRATTAEEAFEWFRSYFLRARENDFLMGRTPRSGEHANWKPDIEYLMKSSGLKQVLEKTNLEATA
ncbi:MULTISPECIES: hypothetical protein [unclassified Variovorax]|uniref:hypothetical protein n=1 Tax=unclassified Variovorax TaxID=663243 RepID=UPI003F490163